MKKTNFTILFKYLLFISISLPFVTPLIELKREDSLYYEEKYFRFLANNYDNLDKTTYWTYLPKEKSIGFQAEKDFGSAIFLKDWSMYGFKLTKIFFKPYCTVQFESQADSCDAEMWLYHTKDAGYYPPGRRIFMKQNFFVIIVPFKKSSINNPSNDSIFEFLRLGLLYEKIKNINNPEEIGKVEVGPIKPVKLFQIIQNQPSYLFEGNLPLSGEDCLFLVFSQYHYLSESYYEYLKLIQDEVLKIPKEQIDEENKNMKITQENGDFYRNWRNLEEMIPSASLMMYNKSKYLNLNLKRGFFGKILLVMIFGMIL